MTMLERTESRAVASLANPRRGIAFVKLHDDLWRMTRASGDVLGYVERFSAPEGHRYRAKRFLARQGRFRIDGEFWNVDDAIDCLYI